MLISFAVTAKLICAFVFAYADCWLFHEAAHLLVKSFHIFVAFVIHFLGPSVQCTDFQFRCGEKILKTTSQYTYLGLLLTEHLDYSLTAKNVTKAANRALGLIIAKDKAFGGLPFRSYTKLFDTMVWSVIKFGSGIWGTKQYSCINAIQTRAERYFLGVGKYTPNAAVHGETAWIPTIVKQWTTVANVWCRLQNMENSRLNYRIFK